MVLHTKACVKCFSKKYIVERIGKEQDLQEKKFFLKHNYTVKKGGWRLFCK
jgi:hypothetical protein